MTIEEIEKILGDKEYYPREMIKFIYESSALLKRNRKGAYLLYPGVQGEMLKMIAPGKYEVMAKVSSLKAYIKKVKNSKQLT